MSLPPAACPHPSLEGQAKAYAAYRKRMHYQYIYQQVSAQAAPRVEAIFSLRSWQDKQDAVDELFETVEAELKQKEEILGLHPQFGTWVERAMEQYLRSIQRSESSENPTSTTLSTPEKAANSKQANEDSASPEGEDPASTPEERENFESQSDEIAVPIFLDCFHSTTDTEDQVVPKILNPLKPHHNHGPGRMVEEWELSAHKTSKRILLRQCTRSIAKVLTENDSARIYVHGRKGIGKVWIQRFAIEFFTVLVPRDSNVERSFPLPHSLPF